MECTCDVSACIDLSVFCELPRQNKATNDFTKADATTLGLMNTAQLPFQPIAVRPKSAVSWRDGLPQVFPRRLRSC